MITQLVSWLAEGTLPAFTAAVAIAAFIPAFLFCVNLRRYRRPSHTLAPDLPLVSVLIPARDEERSIAAAMQSVLASTGVRFELVVMDDGSTDGTREIVTALAEQTRGAARLALAPELPRGWNGKQHACWALAHEAQGELLCFLDADVRLEAAALSEMASELARRKIALLSGFPRQLTETWMEWLELPLIHFVLLGFLPMHKMRRTTRPAYAAGCGQFLLVERRSYFAAGGHAAIRETMHDGLRLPRLLRAHGFRTDLADLTALATCRMYTSAAGVWSGLAKNAVEGLGAPTRIVPITLLLLLGQVAPFVLLLWLLITRNVTSLHLTHRTMNQPSGLVAGALVLAILSAMLPRFLAAWRFRQPLRSAVLHPVGILVLLSIQWYALIRRAFGGAVTWKTRAYAGGS